ncbi:MAG: hypothetical protein C0491_10845 [Novosphingobium sp.]|nr:hypothetical protein [Novosphingobium sp.]
MPDFVSLKTLAKLMSPHAPPAWCKLAVMGAVHTSRVPLYAAKGTVRAYLPTAYIKPRGTLPALLRREHSPDEVIERYGITEDQLQDDEITFWSEIWNDAPARVGLGWFTFHPPWDWQDPTLVFEGFEIPYDYLELFGYDDLHPEGDPDTALYYDATFGDLCLTIEDAESIAPMCDFSEVAFGSKSISPTRKIGRPKGSGFESADEPLVRQMLQDKKKDSAQSGRTLAERYVDQAAGHGTRESKIKRLERRLRMYGI